MRHPSLGVLLGWQLSGDSSTITPGDSTIRPIGGGSGIWNGAPGYVEPIHLPDDTWQHVFHLLH